MQCMKTGLMFNVPEFNDDTYHSDMFYNETTGVILIRGVASGTTMQEPDMKLKTNGDAFEANFLSIDLNAQLKKYYPDLDITDIPIIISDTRFF